MSLKRPIIEIMNKQKRGRVKGEPLKLEVKDKDSNDVTLAARNGVRLLGINLEHNLTWAAHLELGEEKNLLPQLRKKLGVLRHISPEILNCNCIFFFLDMIGIEHKPHLRSENQI